MRFGVNRPVLIDSIEVPDQPLGPAIACRYSIASQRRSMYLHARRSLRHVAVIDLVQATDLSSRRVELVMVYLQVGQGGVEGQLDVGGPRRELQASHDSVCIVVDSATSRDVESIS